MSAKFHSLDLLSDWFSCFDKKASAVPSGPRHGVFLQGGPQRIAQAALMDMAADLHLQMHAPGIFLALDVEKSIVEMIERRGAHEASFFIVF